MPIFSKVNINVLFVHIPKCAGSSIEKIAEDLGWVESFSIRGKSLKDLRYCKASFQHLHAEPLEMLFNLEEFDSIFTVVRNPFLRFKSEYYWQRSKRITSFDVDEWIVDVFEQYSHDPYVYDNHIRPQVEFIPKHEKLQLFKLEDGGVAKAKELFLSLSSEPRQVNSWAKWLTSCFRNQRQEKQSVKDPEIDARFAKHYERIVEFYKQDYSTFSYAELDKPL